METGRDAVLQIVGFTGVGVGEVADVALEGGVTNQGFGAGKFGAVIRWGAGHDGGIVSLDGGIDAGGCGVGGEGFVNKGIEVSVCGDIERCKDEAF